MPSPIDYLTAALELAEEADRDEDGWLTEESRALVQTAYAMVDQVQGATGEGEKSVGAKDQGQPCKQGEAASQTGCIAVDETSGPAKPAWPTRRPSTSTARAPRKVDENKQAGRAVRTVRKVKARLAKVTDAPVARQAKQASAYVGEKTKKFYSFLEKRYGRKTALAVMASGQAVGWGATAAGAVLGVPVWLPGSSLWGGLPVMAMAEVFLRARRLAGSGKAVEKEPDPELIKKLRNKLIKTIWQDYAKWLEQQGVKGEQEPRRGQKSLNHPRLKTGAFGRKGEGQPCKQGETTVTGCIPASGASSGGQAGQQVATPKPKSSLTSVVQSVLKHTGYDAGQVAQAFQGGTDPKNAAKAKVRARVAGSILLGGTAVKDAVLQVIDSADKEAIAAHVKSITIGNVPAALKEFAETPLCDLQILSQIEVRDHPVHGEATCHMESRKITAGTTTRPGSYRHELGHAIRSAMGGESKNTKTALTKAVAAEFEAVQKKLAADPSGLKTKLDHEAYETKYGVAGRRSLDNWEENCAEHYRLYHREIYRDQHEGGGGKHLDQYRQRHPGWAAIWDAWYTAGLIGASLQGGGQ